MPKVQCKNCKADLAEEYNIPKTQRNPCPKCGSLSRSYYVCVSDTATFHEKIGLKARHGSKGKPFYESIGGADFRRKTGRWVKHERIIDREKDIYREVVTDPKTGEILHFCEEPLSEHKGHGAAKLKKKRNNDRY